MRWPTKEKWFWEGRVLIRVDNQSYVKRGSIISIINKKGNEEGRME